MLTEIKFLKYIKRLIWSNKVKAGSAVFITMGSVFLFLCGANLDVVIFCRIWMPVFCTLFFVRASRTKCKRQASKYDRISPHPIGTTWK